MTEVEKIAYARGYIEKLANGINPLNDQPVPDDDLLNNIRISRCLFYVSDLLRQVEEHGGIVGKSVKEKKTPFLLDYDDRLKFLFSETPIAVSEITNRINDLIDTEHMKKLSYKHILDWLIEIDALTVVTDTNGKSAKTPTTRGKTLGISTEQRQGQNGVYTVIVYNREAQQFILDNLDAVVEVSKRSEKQEKVAELQGQPWLPTHDEVLIDLFRKKVPVREIAVTLKRTETGIRARLKKLGYIEERSAAE